MSESRHFAFMRAAIAAGERATAKGNHPFGAVLVIDGQMRLVAENGVITGRDCTHHAELLLLQEAQRQFGRADLEQSTLYASTEPCAMCAGAIYWAGVRRVVFGCRAQTMAKYTTGSLVVPCAEIFARGRVATDVVGPILEAEAEASHRTFWQRSLSTSG